MIKSFSATNYKNLAVAPVHFGRTNVFIGPNNSGKSNLFDGLGFLLDWASSGSSRGLLDAVNAHGGPHLLNHGRGDRGLIEISWRVAPSPHQEFSQFLGLIIERQTGRDEQLTGVRTTKERLDIRVGEDGLAIVRSVGERAKIELNGAAVEVKEDVVTEIQHLWQLPPADLDVSDIRSIRSSTHEAFLEWRRGVHHLACAQLKPSELTRPAEVAYGEAMLNDDGSNLANVLREWELTDHSWPKALSGRLAEALQNLHSTDGIRVNENGGYRWVELQVDGRWSALKLLSDGTAQLLVVAMLLFGQRRLNVLTLDEPELNLHPAWLQIVGRWILRASSVEQLFVSTHSPELLDQWTEAFRSGDLSLFVVGADGEPGRVKQVQPADVEPMLEEGWQLGDLYRVADPSLGGWPW